MVTVTVPATSANVGAGFDSLGLAVSMHNVFTFEESDRIQISSVDGTHVPAGSNNLVYRSARVVYDQLGIPLKVCASPSATTSRWRAASGPARPASWRASWARTPCWATS
mgnify:CR=1 FL=1